MMSFNFEAILLDYFFEPKDFSINWRHFLPECFVLVDLIVDELAYFLFAAQKLFI